MLDTLNIEKDVDWLQPFVFLFLVYILTYKVTFIMCPFACNPSSPFNLWQNTNEFLTVGEIILKQKRSKKRSVGLLYLCQSEYKFKAWSQAKKDDTCNKLTVVNHIPLSFDQSKAAAICTTCPIRNKENII